MGRDRSPDKPSLSEKMWVKASWIPPGDPRQGHLQQKNCPVNPTHTPNSWNSLDSSPRSGKHWQLLECSQLSPFLWPRDNHYLGFHNVFISFKNYFYICIHFCRYSLIVLLFELSIMRIYSMHSFVTLDIARHYICDSPTLLRILIVWSCSLLYNIPLYWCTTTCLSFLLLMDI